MQKSQTILSGQSRSISIPIMMGGLSVALMGLVACSVTNGPDRRVLEELAPFITERRTRIMLGITYFGKHQFLIPANLALIGLLFLLKKPQQAVVAAVTALSSLGLMLLLKNLFQRPRPDGPLVEGVRNYGFPSGHALMSVAFFGLLIWLTVKDIRNKTWRVVLVAVLAVFTLLIGFSRVYLRVHYPSDVLAGWAIGACWLFIAVYLAAEILRRNAAGAGTNAGA